MAWISYETGTGPKPTGSQLPTYEITGKTLVLTLTLT